MPVTSVWVSFEGMDYVWCAWIHDYDDCSWTSISYWILTSILISTGTYDVIDGEIGDDGSAWMNQSYERKIRKIFFSSSYLCLLRTGDQLVFQYCDRPSDQLIAQYYDPLCE